MKSIWFSAIMILACSDLANAAPRDVVPKPLSVPPVAFLSVSNTAGLLKYCVKKGFISEDEIGRPLTSRFDSSKEPSLKALARRAEAVGQRGVLLVFGNGKDPDMLPAATLEDVAALDSTEPKSICMKLINESARPGQ
ncbi:hypothetical protein [Brucella intermedia]|uniref:hypothetical protein n=1 Tax=Brucella intermedia TaxID=94625 RepID=UPI00046A9696|nr:hypothetical protein [Brucella intermedia]